MQKRSKLIDVFVGESNDGHAELLEASLREAGLVNKPYRGLDAAETLALIRGAQRGFTDVTSHPSLVLLDCGLPRVGGVGVLRALNGDRRYRWIPVIMMTTVYNRQQAEQCRRLGCEAYVTKWTVFLGLPGFVSRIRFLADRAIWIASRRLSAGRSHICGTRTTDLRSVHDVARTHRCRQECIGKEGKRGTATL